MPKHSGQLLEFQTALKVCYDRKDVNNGWIENGHALQGIAGFTLYLYQEYNSANIAGHSTPKRDNSDYTKDAQLPLYFGFMEIADSRSNALRRITPSGVAMYEALIANDKEKIYSLFMNALETVTFGRNNSACENSDSDLEAPNILLLSSVILDGIKRKEYYYLLEVMNESAYDFSYALSKIAYYRDINEDIPTTAVTYTDAKIIPFWVTIGFLSEDSDGRLHISTDVLRLFGDRILKLRVKNNEPIKQSKRTNTEDSVTQKIFYGCPGTGKSHRVKKDTEGLKGELATYFDEEGHKIPTPDTKEERERMQSNIFRTTFHPDYDYAAFVGSYKPVMKPALDSDGKKTGREELSYDFVPQVFTNAYIRARRSLADDSLSDSEKQVYLIIEEINRGNCAQIFGDLFQLLDRDKDGRSEYGIIPEAELGRYLSNQGIDDHHLRLPENLHIYATMNTSDQSLFPMDSAFKRRWEMEYIPIKLDDEKSDAKDYSFTVNGVTYSWVEFLKKVNPLIRKATDSEDKQMGEFFIKIKKTGESLTEEEFKNKVMFYLWNDVCKDLYSASRISPDYFLRDDASTENRKAVFTFAELYGEGRINTEDNAEDNTKTITRTSPEELLEGFITKKLGMKPKDAVSGKSGADSAGDSTPAE